MAYYQVFYAKRVLGNYIKKKFLLVLKGTVLFGLNDLVIL